MLTKQVPKILILIGSLIAISFAQTIVSYKYPSLGLLLGDLTSNQSLMTYLNSTNNYPDKYLTLQAKGPYLTRTTTTGKL